MLIATQFPCRFSDCARSRFLAEGHRRLDFVAIGTGEAVAGPLECLAVLRYFGGGGESEGVGAEVEGEAGGQGAEGWADFDLQFVAAGNGGDGEVLNGVGGPTQVEVVGEAAVRGGPAGAGAAENSGGEVELRQSLGPDSGKPLSLSLSFFRNRAIFGLIFHLNTKS